MKKPITIKECEVCKVSFPKRRDTKGKFCSTKCYWESMSFGEKPNCLVCDKKLSSHKSLYCHPCVSKKNTGVNNHRWIKDRTKIKQYWTERNNPEYKQWRTAVWLRDNFTCKIANPDCKGRIEAHHILGWSSHPELRYQTNNGITLCHAHHPRKRAEEKRLAPAFQALVSVLN